MAALKDTTFSRL